MKPCSNCQRSCILHIGRLYFTRRWYRILKIVEATSICSELKFAARNVPHLCDKFLRTDYIPLIPKCLVYKLKGRKTKITEAIPFLNKWSEIHRAKQHLFHPYQLISSLGNHKPSPSIARACQRFISSEDNRTTPFLGYIVALFTPHYHPGPA